MDKVLLTIAAMGIGFLLWEMQGEIKDQQAILAMISRKMETPAPIPSSSPSPLPLPEQKPCIVQIMPGVAARKPPLQLHPSIVK